MAVWHVSSAGMPTGAWLRPEAELLTDADRARRLLDLLERRAITGSSLEVVGDWLEQLSVVAGLGNCGNWWKPNVFSMVEAFQDCVDRRRTYAATVNAERERNKSISDLAWPHDLPEGATPADFAGLRALAAIASPEGPPVVSEALTIARLLTWLVAVWAETEEVKSRRSYVRARHGAVEPLPPSWMNAVRTAAGPGMPS
jgi:Family of unknown function (DUF6218)